MNSLRYYAEVTVYCLRRWFNIRRCMNMATNSAQMARKTQENVISFVVELAEVLERQRRADSA